MKNNEEKEIIVPVRTMTFDPRRKELTTINSIDSMKLPSGEVSKDFGSNKNVQVLKERGIIELVKSLNAEKNTYQRQHKNVDEQIKGLKLAILSDKEKKFIKAYEGVKLLSEKYKQQTQLLDAKTSAENMITEINKQLAEVKGVVKEHIKF